MREVWKERKVGRSSIKQEALNRLSDNRPQVHSSSSILTARILNSGSNFRLNWFFGAMDTPPKVI
jgi:hypothetical protein